MRPPARLDAVRRLSAFLHVAEDGRAGVAASVELALYAGGAWAIRAGGGPLVYLPASATADDALTRLLAAVERGRTSEPEGPAVD